LRKPIRSCGSSKSEHAQAGTETEMASHASDNSQTRPAPGPNKTPENLTPPYLCQPFMGANFVTRTAPRKNSSVSNHLLKPNKYRG